MYLQPSGILLLHGGAVFHDSLTSWALKFWKSASFFIVTALR
jgi:hypothetical protein